MEVGPGQQGSGVPQVGASLGGLRPPITPCSFSFPGPHMAVGTKYGMPSSHSQFMWFFSVYSFLFLYLR